MELLLPLMVLAICLGLVVFAHRDATRRMAELKQRRQFRKNKNEEGSPTEPDSVTSTASRHLAPGQDDRISGMTEHMTDAGTGPDGLH